MEGNDPNQSNNSNQPYPYDPYQNYYYSQYYGAQPTIPQGDPSAALSTMVYQLEQQTQQRQAMGAMAAASISSVLNNRPPVADYYSNYYGNPQQRSMIQYDDLSTEAAPTAVKQPVEEPKDPTLDKPKLCCNRWLKSALAIAQHEKLHIKCPSCDYMCLKSALLDHEEFAHGKLRKESEKKPSRPDGVIPPNAPRIETPEELAAWIADRKKNWPSKDNIERKKIEEEEKEARGEISNKKRAANKRRDQQIAKRQKIEEKKNSLVAQYDSDSDSDTMDPERDAISSKDPSSMGKILLPEDRPKRRCKYFLSGKCHKGDDCDFSHEKPAPKPPKQPKPAPTFKKKPNLLYKLLEKEIMQEKSVILQCLRYIVDNNYFGKGDNEKTLSEPSQPLAEHNKAESTTDQIEHTVTNNDITPVKQDNEVIISDVTDQTDMISHVEETIMVDQANVEAAQEEIQTIETNMVDQANEEAVQEETLAVETADQANAEAVQEEMTVETADQANAEAVQEEEMTVETNTSSNI